MSGDPIYLVSACTTGEQFVAAFRRYADRSGLFIPIADPIPVGKRGRFAVTLADGGVMVEGEAEVVSSTRTPSVLHGRIGMTVRFLETDEASKTTLVELEKARLAMKPPPPSEPPRPAVIPAEPRPVPPAPSGRVDAANALAECVAIGDVALLEAAPPAPKPTGPKFVVPSIAPVPVDDRRARSPSGPHRARVPSTPPPASSPPARPRPPTGQQPEAAQPPASSPPARPRPPTGQQPVTERPGEPPVRETIRGTKPGGPTSTQPSAVVPPPRPATPSTPPPMPSLPAPGDSGKIRHATMALPAIVRAPAPVSGSGPVPEAVPQASSGPVPEPSVIITPSGPTAVGTAPIIEPAPSTDEHAVVLDPSLVESVPVAEIDLDEPTDLTDIPLTLPITPAPAAAVTGEASGKVEKSDRIPRKTVLGIAVVPAGMTVLPATASSPGLPVPDTSVMATQKPTVEEPTPSGNWTLTPGADKPTIEPRGPRVEIPPAVPAELAVEQSSPEIKKPVERLTGDWSIALDPERPDGWSEPSKIEKRPVRAQTSPGPPVAAVASTRDIITAPVKAEPDPSTSEPKVQIDPTLIEVAKEMPPDELVGSGLGMSGPYPVPATPSAVHALATGPTGMHPIAGPTSAPLSAPVLVPPTPSGVYPRAPSQSGELGYVTPPMSGPVPVQTADGFVPVIPTPHPGQLSPFAPPPGSIVGTGSQAAYAPAEPPGYAPQPRFGSEPNMFGGQSFVGEPAYAPPKSKRTLVIVVSALLAVAVGVVALVMVTRDDGDGTAQRDRAAAPHDGGGAPALREPVDAPSASIAPTAPVVAMVDASTSPEPAATPGSAAPKDPGSAAPDAGSSPPPTVTATTPPEPTLQMTGDCTVDVASTPTGAELAIGPKVVGTTPTKLTLPCAEEVKLVARKARFNSAVRLFTPNKSPRLKLKLDHQTFQVKVSSSPSGATVTVGGKSIGVTPSTARLPAFETSVLVFSKPGYQSETQRVTPKQNNQTIHTPLKKSGKKPK